MACPSRGRSMPTGQCSCGRSRCGLKYYQRSQESLSVRKLTLHNWTSELAVSAAVRGGVTAWKSGSNFAKSIVIDVTSSDNDSVSTRVKGVSVGQDIRVWGARDTGRWTKWGAWKGSLNETRHVSVVGDDSLQVLGGCIQSGLGVAAGGVGNFADIGSLDNSRGDWDGLVGSGGTIDTSALTVENRVDLDTGLWGNSAQSNRSIQSSLKFSL